MALTVTPLTPTFGARISGFELRADASPALTDEISDLWHQYKLLVFPGQDTAQETDLVGFSGAFGELEIHVREEFLSPDNPELLYVSNIIRDGRPIGILSTNEVGWHYDQIYLERPAVGSLLQAVQIPPADGATSFADMVTAYARLPAATRAKIDGRSAVQSYENFNAAYSVPTSDKQKQRTPDREHPLVRTHPYTGERALYICPGMTTRIVGMDQAESDALLEELFEWTVRDEFVYSHQWSLGDCVMWDNAATMHRREPFDPKYERLMKRTTILPTADRAVPFFAPDGAPAERRSA
ncbi:MAG: TauD/TfdA family dioxygenase [Gammaproteobacteria bacterium]|nr:TauD/TfdA family dioxygenase [Gammaproteobacteria bacterium]NNM01908.1 TauD/TfdA family dioxygenase [Gammaproteobacteria bacterium]